MSKAAGPGPTCNIPGQSVQHHHRRPSAHARKAAGAPDRNALPVAGDDPQTKAVVIDLADQLGFDGIDTGGLDDSWRQQPGTPVYTTDLDAEHARKALACAEPQDTTAWRRRLQAHRA